MKLKLGGLWWWFRYSRKLEIHYGYRDPPETKAKRSRPSGPRREVVVQEALKGERRLEITIHEFLHACDKSDVLGEDWIAQTARESARALYRLGWRQNG